MEIWEHDGKLYEVNSHDSLPDDAWRYELVGLAGPPEARQYLAIAIPDGTPDDGPFTPQPAGKATFSARGDGLPWPILRRFIGWVEASGDLVDSERSEDRPGTAESPATRRPFAPTGRRC